MVNYNLTNVTSAISIHDTLIAVNNDLTGGIFGVFILLAVFFIAFISLKRFDNRIVFLASSFITTLAGVLMWTAEIIGLNVLFIPIALLAGTILYNLWVDG